MDIAAAREHCARGARRHAEGDLAGAMADFEQALAAHSGCAEALNNRGAARYAGGDLAGALADFDRALELNPRYAEALNNRGIVRQARGDCAGALTDFDQALAIRPRYAEALYNRAAVRLALRDAAGAVPDLDRAIGIRPTYADAYLSRAAALDALGDLDGAAADYDQALRLVPRPAAAPVYQLRAGVRFRQRRFAGAVADCDRALERDPGLCLAYISRGNARYHLRDLGGLADYRAAFALDPWAAAADVIRFLADDVREDSAAALENCRKHLRICPDDVVAYARRGLTRFLLGQAAEAAKDFEEALRRSPDWRDHLELLIETARRQEG
jgi:tetratricopeptide (TPR) repeat protein